MYKLIYFTVGTDCGRVNHTLGAVESTAFKTLISVSFLDYVSTDTAPNEF